tara:strand:+ start:2106 stop:2585 length:480 start_codon:yes stop_codon:yes gene_type:complete
MPGVGKTTIGKSLSRMLKVKHIDTDDLIESEQASSVCDIIENKGESVFRFLEKRCLENSLSQEQLAVISTGGGIVVDSDNRVLIKKKACVIHIKCSIDEIAKRLSSSSRPLLYSTNKKQKLNELWSERSAWYESAAHKEIDITGLSELHIVQRLYEEIR